MPIWAPIAAAVNTLANAGVENARNAQEAELIRQQQIAAVKTRKGVIIISVTVVVIVILIVVLSLRKK